MPLWSDFKGTLNSFFRIGQVRLKDDAGNFNVRNANDTDWSEVSASCFNAIAYSSSFDFENGITGTIFTSSINGAAASVAAIAVYGGQAIGVVRLGVGTTATGRAAITTAASIIRLGSGEATFEAIVRPVFLPTSAEDFTVRIGFIDTGLGDSVDGVYFEFNSGNANWVMCTASNSVRTKTTTTTTVAVTDCLLKIVVNAAGTLANFYYNNNLLGSVNTNIPVGVSRETGWGAGIFKSVGTSDRSIDIDWMRVRIKQSSPRFT